MASQDNGQLYLWLFLGVPGAFIGAWKAFKRNDQVMGRRLTKIGVTMMIGFVLFFGFISWRISQNTNRLLNDFDSGASSFNTTDLLPGVPVEEQVTAPSSERVYTILAFPPGRSAAYQTGTVHIINERLDLEGLGFSVTCLGDRILVTTEGSEDVFANRPQLLANLPVPPVPETVQTYPPSTAGVDMECES